MRCFVSATLSLLAIISLTIALSPAPVQADFMQAYSGNTRAKGEVGTGIDGTFSFAVIDDTGDRWQDAVGGFTFVPALDYHGGGLDTKARYLYLYQALNDGTNSTTIDDVTINLSHARYGDITSWGYFMAGSNGVSLRDSQGRVGDLLAPGNPQLNAFGDTDNAVYSLGVAPPKVGFTPGSAGFDSNLTDLKAPFMMRLVPQSTTLSLKAYFDPIVNPPQPGDFRSTIFGFTSNVAPGFDTVNFQDGGGQAIGTVVAPVPEPATVAGLLTLLPLLGWWAWRNRRKSS
jgi:hypothetical protein